MKRAVDSPCVGRCKPISIGALLSMLVDVAVKRKLHVKKEKADKQVNMQSTKPLWLVVHFFEHSNQKSDPYQIILTTVAIEIGQ